MTDLTQIFADTISRLPWTAHAAAVAVLLSGIILWIVGEKALRFLVQGAGLLTGAIIGWWMTDAIGMPLPQWVGAIAGALIAVLVFLALLRFLVAISLSATLAIIAPLIVVSLIAAYGSPLENQGRDHFGPLSEDALFFRDIPIAKDDLSGPSTLFGGYWSPQKNSESPSKNDQNPSKSEPDEAQDSAISERVELLAAGIWSEVAYAWNAQPTRDRGLLLLALLCGGAVGLGVGAVLPRKAAALVAAGLGAAMWLVAGIWLLHASGWMARIPMGDDMRVWLGVWVGISVLGAGFQWMRPRPRADNA